MRSLAELRMAVVEAIDASREEIIAFGEQVWKNPEPGYREFQTSALAVERLGRLGLTVQEHLAMTGFRTDLDSGKPGPIVALLGEMDSLILPEHPDAHPETGAVHACGHHTHIAALVGAAIGLCQAEATKELSGKIALLGVPAEEGIEFPYRMSLLEQGKIQYFSGKAQMVREGVFADIDMALMNHVGSYYVADFNGHVKKQVAFLGKSSHAASPQNGVNALNAANLALHAIALLRETFGNDDRIRVHGIISEGGDAVNIVPNRVVMNYYLRADTLYKINDLSRVFDRAVKHSALALGADVEIQTLPGSLPLNNDDILCELFRDTVLSLDPSARVSVKAAFNQGCTDMGDLSQIMPALHAGVPGCSGGCHSVDFKISDPESAYITNAKLLALYAVELLYGNAEKARHIAARKASMLSIPDYLAQLESFRRLECTRKPAE